MALYITDVIIPTAKVPKVLKAKAVLVQELGTFMDSYFLGSRTDVLRDYICQTPAMASFTTISVS